LRVRSTKASVQGVGSAAPEPLEPGRSRELGELGDGPQRQLIAHGRIGRSPGDDDPAPIPLDERRPRRDRCEEGRSPLERAGALESDELAKLGAQRTHLDEVARRG
jgi:hypothetical protein